MPTIFNDEIVTATELKAKQKMWFEKAWRNPVSVTSGKKKLVIVNRETARQMYAFNYYADLLIRLGRELRLSPTSGSKVFSWMIHLNAGEIDEFYDELLAGFEEAASHNQWEQLEELLAAWQATAEAKSNPATAVLLKDGQAVREYVRLD
ncbi:MAG: hypothetical protein P3T54_02790 [Dehalogenimonas sp.]|uniref:Uncharacterized protein n=1 Tax=Candidatus Dehalogenimonas loeffleri TaxID=3127115 RepID=A0ABZ2J9N9_9CHLR|nr:hypothetical protein [Dehalogenimonas sp.]